MSIPELTRRNIIIAGTAGAAAAALAACSSGTGSASGSSANAKATGSASVPSNTVITAAADVPVGGAVLVTSGKTPYVVGQQTAGEVTCHVAICTHAGCKLNRISGENAICPCHGSEFNIFTGEVTQGPATKALPRVTVAVSGGNVVGG